MKNKKFLAFILAITLVFSAGIGVYHITGTGPVQDDIPIQDADADNDGYDWGSADDSWETLWGNKKGQTGSQGDAKPTAPAVSRAELQKYGTIKTLVKSVDNPTKPDPKAVSKTSYGVVDWSTVAQGYITFTPSKDYLFYLAGPTHVCGMFNVAKDETIKIGLTDGAGKYEYAIGIKTNHETMQILYKNSFQVNAIDSDLAPYLVSTPYGDFENAPEAVKKANISWSGTKSQLDNVKGINKWVDRTLKYDKTLKTGVAAVYANPDKVLENGGGVCSEFSKLLTAMLRSQGVPAYYEAGKSISTGGSHAWVTAWVELSSEHKDGKTYSTGAWVLLEPTNGCIYNHATLGNGQYETRATDYKN